VKAQFNNTLKLNKTAINAPFMIEQTPIGVVLDVTEETFTVEIWDKYCSYEFNKKPYHIHGVYLSTKEQNTYDELMKMLSDK
jgi:hypothetical protein